MNWEKDSKFSQRAGRYSVSAARVAGKWRYTAWRLPSANEKIAATVEQRPKPQPRILACFDTPGEARAACERDAA